MNTVLSMYLTLMPVIFAGVANMIFCKSNLLAFAYFPMDNYYVLSDGKRLFGDNKTWKGFFGMIALTIICQLLWGKLFQQSEGLENLHFIYQKHSNTLQLNLSLGFLLGLAYVLCELPNSFVKRRLNIYPGKTAENKFKYLFIFIDQADSIIGCVLVLTLYVSLSVPFIIAYILLGALTHIIINHALYVSGLRRNPF